MNYEELKLVYGGASLSGAVISALVRAFDLALELGRALGSSLRRHITKKAC
ncbi:MAG: hypothetical protein IJB83_00110 [Bacilli bacterium]|nr:hypothetical protein [Bacilli bacterium]